MAFGIDDAIILTLVLGVGAAACSDDPAVGTPEAPDGGTSPNPADAGNGGSTDAGFTPDAGMPDASTPVVLPPINDSFASIDRCPIRDIQIRPDRSLVGLCGYPKNRLFTIPYLPGPPDPKNPDPPLSVQPVIASQQSAVRIYDGDENSELVCHEVDPIFMEEMPNGDYLVLSYCKPGSRFHLTRTTISFLGLSTDPRNWTINEQRLNCLDNTRPNICSHNVPIMLSALIAADAIHLPMFFIDPFHTGQTAPDLADHRGFLGTYTNAQPTRHVTTRPTSGARPTIIQKFDDSTDLVLNTTNAANTGSMDFIDHASGDVLETVPFVVNGASFMAQDTPTLRNGDYGELMPEKMPIMELGYTGQDRVALVALPDANLLIVNLEPGKRRAEGSIYLNYEADTSPSIRGIDGSQVGYAYVSTRRDVFKVNISDPAYPVVEGSPVRAGYDLGRIAAQWSGRVYVVASLTRAEGELPASVLRRDPRRLSRIVRIEPVAFEETR